MSGVTITFSSPYHHQANSLAERAVGTCKSLWKKAVESSKCPYTALWMYRVTPLDNHLPSPYELLYGCKPKTLMPSSKKDLQSRHPDNENHQEKNYERQQRQAEAHDRKANIRQKNSEQYGTSICEKYHQENFGSQVLSSIDQTLLESQELTLLI